MLTFDWKHIASCLIVAIAAGWFLMACNRTTDPPPPPLWRALEIDLYNTPPEVDPQQNVYLSAQVKNEAGVLQQGIKVFFDVDPETLGIITPWAWTEPDSPNGLRSQVVFNSSNTGLALITGSVTMENGSVVADTVHVLVRDPING